MTQIFRNLLETDYSVTRSDDFDSIQDRVKKGRFRVDYVTNVVLVNLNVINTDGLTFDKKVLNSIGNQKNFYYEGPLNGDIIFSMSAKQSSEYRETH